MMNVARHYWPALVVAVVTLIAALGWAPRVVVACTLDNKPSLEVNGIHAMRNPVAPTGVGVWAPFVINRPFASGVAVRVTELRANLVRTLSSATLATPFRWNLGDGTVVLGHTITHRYAHPGLYQVVVYALDTRARVWFPFDRVLLHIVRSDSLPQVPHVFVASAPRTGIPAMPELVIGGTLLSIGIGQTVRLFNRWRRRAALQVRIPLRFGHGAMD